MKRLLILFAKGFPYNFSEPFLEQEYPLYKDYFDKVLIVTGCGKKELPTRQMTDPSLEILCDHTLSNDLRSILEALPWVLTDRMFYRELKHLVLHEGFSLRKLYELLVMSLCANHRAILARRWLKRHSEYLPSLLYSYWMQIPAYASVRLNYFLGDSCKTITRAHRFDLYSERHRTEYLPFHRQLYDELHEIAVISEDGKRYLESKYGCQNKVSVHRLGALDLGCRNPSAARDVFRIVSCSRTIPIKRVERIVDVLQQIADRPVHWTHLGGGGGLDALKHYAADHLPANVTATFLGSIANTQVYEIYKTQPFHIFLNVSKSEGVPVSIMEAMSFGIPVIATAVGGTPELIDNGVNGYLLPEDYDDTELAQRLRDLWTRPDTDYQALRQASREKFEQDYDAIHNYRKFLDKITSRSNTP